MKKSGPRIENVCVQISKKFQSLGIRTQGIEKKVVPELKTFVFKYYRNFKVSVEEPEALKKSGPEIKSLLFKSHTNFEDSRQGKKWSQNKKL